MLQLLFPLDFSPRPLRLVTAPCLAACVEPRCIEVNDSEVADSLEQLTVPKGLLSDNPNCEQTGPVCHKLLCTHVVPPALCPVLTRVTAPLAEVVGLKSL